MRKLIWFWLVLLLSNVELACQTNVAEDTVIILNTFELTAAKVEKIAVLKIKKEEPASQLDQQIARNGFAFIKNYGVGRLSSITVRGTGSRHTKLYWDGVPLNSPMLGEIDYSLIPAFYFDGVQFIDDSQGLHLGEGALGVAINLNAQSDQRDFVRISQQFSSLMNSGTELTLNKSFKKWSSKTQLFSHFGKNRFQFRDQTSAGKPITTTERTDFQQYGAMQQFRLKLNGDQELSLQGWFHYSDRDFEFPIGNQKDTYIRTKLDYLKRWQSSGITKFKAAWLKEYFNYKELKSNARKVFLTANHFQPINQSSSIKVSANWEKDAAVAGGYSDGVNQTKGAIALGYNQYFGTDYKLSATVREIIVDKTFSPLLYGIDLQYLPLELFKVNASFSKDYNYPTINSRYWDPGGNPLLKPEHSYSGIIGVQSSFEKKKRWSYTAKVNGYLKHVKDWILWTPTASVWEAKNIRTVNSLGGDLDVSSLFYAGNHVLGISGVYTYVSSRVKASEDTNDKSLGNQLIYTPSFQYKGELSWKFEAWSVRYWQEYIHIRYVTDDNLVYLPGYYLGNLSLGYQLKWKKTKMSLQFDVHNISNADYQVVSGRPMPMRHYQLSLTTNIVKEKE